MNALRTAQIIVYTFVLTVCLLDVAYGAEACMEPTAPVSTLALCLLLGMIVAAVIVSKSEPEPTRRNYVPPRRMPPPTHVMPVIPAPPPECKCCICRTRGTSVHKGDKQ